MDGTHITSSADLPNPGPSWHVAEAADFNGDGKSDILWQHADGTPAIWIMDGTHITSSADLPNPGPSWHVAEAADFNGDGKSDILWQHADGTPAIWTMDGTHITSSADLPNPGPSWHAAETADVNGDGKSDILWQHGDGTPVIWTMDGTNITSRRVPAQSWQRLALGIGTRHRPHRFRPGTTCRGHEDRSLETGDSGNAPCQRFESPEVWLKPWASSRMRWRRGSSKRCTTAALSMW